MFARRMLVVGAFALVGLSADTVSAQAPVQTTTYSVPLAMPSTVVTQSTPVMETTTVTRGRRGRRAVTVVQPAGYTAPMTPVMTQPGTMMMAQSTVPMPMPSTTTTTVTPGTTTGMMAVTTPGTTVITTAPPMMTTDATTVVSTTPARRGLFGRLRGR